MEEQSSSLKPLSASQMEVLEMAVADYQFALALDGEASTALKARGIESEEIATYRLGCVGDPHVGHEHLRGWLAIPYLDRWGKPLSIRFRRPFHSDDNRKYMSLAGDKGRVFNVRAIHEAHDTIHVAEGELDAIILNKVGLPAVALPGVSSWKPHYRRVLAGFNRIWVWGDPDEAGREMVLRITSAMGRARGVRLTEGDVTDTYIKGGPEALKGLVQ